MLCNDFQTLVFKQRWFTPHSSLLTAKVRRSHSPGPWLHVSSSVTQAAQSLLPAAEMERVDSLKLAIKHFQLAQNCLLVLLNCKEWGSIMLPRTRRDREQEKRNTQSAACLAWAMESGCVDTDVWEARSSNGVCHPKYFFPYLLSDHLLYSFFSRASFHLPSLENASAWRSVFMCIHTHDCKHMHWKYLSIWFLFNFQQWPL